MNNVLIIGGTRFVGRHIAQAFVRAGASVTLFNRGNAYGDPITGVSSVHGDRRSDLHRLGDATWDAVVDTCAYVPLEAEIAARFFANKTGTYLFVSTISVYDSSAGKRIDEDSPLNVLPANADRTRMIPETYGALKVLCEEIVLSTFRDGAAILRPGLVAGPYDPTDRFTYWPLRIANGGNVLLPESPAQPVQYIDARDLAQFALTLAQHYRGGVYNVVTTPGEVTFGSLFEAGRRAAHVRANPVYRDAATLLKAGIAPWADLPLWIPSNDPDITVARSWNARARGAGLHLRSVDATVADVLAWARRAGKRIGNLRTGLTPARESELLP
jgi:2'-hydroxyisoflavone reductase